MKRNSVPGCLLIAMVSVGCSGDGSEIEAYVQYRVKFPEDVADTLELPAVLTLSLGHEGKEEALSSGSEQRTVVLCRPLEPFVYHGSVNLRATCRRGDFYARASVREIQLKDPDVCDEADTDGVLILSHEEYFENAQIFADDSTLAFDDRDCGLQNAEVELSLQKLN